MHNGRNIELLDLIMCLSDAMDFIDPAIVDHHRQVAYIAYNIGTELGLPRSELKQLVLAGSLHDIGAFSLRERRDLMVFEVSDPHGHARNGYTLLRLFEPLSAIAPVVRFHHVSWGRGAGREFRGREVPLLSHIIHLSDRIAVLLDKKKEILGQVSGIIDTIRNKAGSMFKPELVDVFRQVAAKEYFWLDLSAPSMQMVLSQRMKAARISIDSGDMLGFSELFSRIIDFKSPFTTTHSSGVAACAEFLARKTGFAKSECTAMRIAGHMHDLGKLAVPVEILDKPARLSRKEYNVGRHHSFYTYRILQPVAPLQTINTWAALHHERLDGSGYPFHLKKKDLPLGSQIMAVADVFTALTEDRPYRSGMKQPGAMRILDTMSSQSALNREIIAVLRQHYDETDDLRRRAQSSARRKYRDISAERSGQ
ncbi:MAG TPA: HD domain-containing phosphohydrolase [Thermodesulfovibrionales bacterium]|nr:HD domain-containing phosphohydrolase [Thermodesulfovibrionales bacterium]